MSMWWFYSSSDSGLPKVDVPVDIMGLQRNLAARMYLVVDVLAVVAFKDVV